ncbi:unnamed protein product, partial [marine sediment metagenome]
AGQRAEIHHAASQSPAERMLKINAFVNHTDKYI